MFVRIVSDRRTHLGFHNLRGVQGPSDPPLDLVTLLPQGTVRTIVAYLKNAVVMTSNLMTRVGTASQPFDLGVTEFDSCRAPLTGMSHDRHRTVQSLRRAL